jgi:hypothetical protein
MEPSDRPAHLRAEQRSQSERRRGPPALVRQSRGYGVKPGRRGHLRNMSGRRRRER